MERQAQNQQHMASVRASETPEQTLHRRQSNKQSMSSMRKRNVSVECAVSAFHSKVKLGPDYVCTCCHRMMYRKSVIPCNKTNYTKASADVVQKVFSADLSYISFDGKQWVCRTCDRTLKRGNMPLQAKGQWFTVVPCASRAFQPKCIGTQIDLPACTFYENGGIAYW